MSLASFSFLIFAAIVVIAYYLTPLNWRWVALLIASYAFYLISSAQTLVFLVLTTVVTFFGGLLIGKQNSNSKAFLESGGESLTKEEKKTHKDSVKRKKRRIVAVVLLFVIGVLAVLKYFRVYLAALQIPGLNFDTGAILLPLGVSFYTFQSAAYIIDLYRDKIEPDTNIAKFALFTSFFPQIIQGPIARHSHLANQLYSGHSFSYTNLAHGAQLMLWGFFKKLVIADRAAILVNQVFDNYSDYSGWAIVAAMLFYMIQIYGDFSGGIDIARGVARCLGIDMAHNFRRPYFATSLSDFWRRWHISLSSWCRDYIFFPISLSRTFGKAGRSLRSIFGARIGKLFPILLAQLATFVTIGLWHGAEFKYIAYGLYNAAVIISGLLLEPYLTKCTKALHINTDGILWKLFSMSRTFVIVAIGRLLPRAQSFSAAVTMFCSISALHNTVGRARTIESFGLLQGDYIVLLFACLVWLLVSILQERLEKRAQGESGTTIVAGENTAYQEAEETGAECRKLIDSLPLPIRWVIYLLGFTCVLIFGVYGSEYDAASFIYRGF